MNWGRGVHVCLKLLVLCACSMCWMSVASVVRKKDLFEVVVTAWFLFILLLLLGHQTLPILQDVTSGLPFLTAVIDMPSPAPPLPWNNCIGWLGIKHPSYLQPHPQIPCPSLYESTTKTFICQFSKLWQKAVEEMQGWVGHGLANRNQMHSCRTWHKSILCLSISPSLFVCLSVSRSLALSLFLSDFSFGPLLFFCACTHELGINCWNWG